MKKKYSAWQMARIRAASINGSFWDLPCAGNLTKDIFPAG
jgi:hypothetical protein